MSQRPIQTWVNSTQTLQNIFSKAYYLNQLTLSLRQHLSPELSAHCQVMNYTGGKLKILVDSPVWASRLRFCIPAMQKNLMALPAFSDLQTIEYSVKTFHQPIAKVAGKPLRLSVASADLLAYAAESVADLKLQQALLRLAQRANKS